VGLPHTPSRLTLNLMQGSCINPNLSAWAQVYGNYDFNRTPIAPPGGCGKPHYIAFPPDITTSSNDTHFDVKVQEMTSVVTEEFDLCLDTAHNSHQ